MRRIVFLVVLSVGLFFLLFVVGLRSIINATIFVNELVTGKSDAAQNEDFYEDFFGTLIVDEPFSATNSAQILMSGAVTEFNEVEYFINNVSVKKEKIAANDQFSEEIGKLKTGSNKIYVVVQNTKAKQKKQSEVFSVLYKKEKPKLEIESPKDGDTTNKNELSINGKTDKDVEITVNKSHVVVDLEGNFSKTVRLQEGENKIEVVATDIAGNEEKQTLTIKYDKDD